MSCSKYYIMFSHHHAIAGAKSSLIIRIGGNGAQGAFVKRISVSGSLEYEEIAQLCRDVQQMHDDNVEMDIDDVAAYVLL